MKKLLMLILPGIFSLQVLAQEMVTDVPIHDPVIIRQNSTWYIFATSKGIAVWSSTDRKHWQKQAPVFAQAPQWAKAIVPNFKNHIWAPDISYHHGLYYLYYSVSAFGKNTSAIGVATNKTLHRDDKNYTWKDHGIIIRSVPGKTNWNAIDPNFITDEKGHAWLAFGSFWSGIKLVKLSKDRLHVSGDTINLPTIASRFAPAKQNLEALPGNPPDAGGNAIEAPFICKKPDWYYLFVSVDYCCKGINSTYKMLVGRSRNITGPYLDRQNKPLAQGGGTLVLQGNEHWNGVGHNAVFNDKNFDYLIFHGYDAGDNGKSKLRIEKISWENGWPVIHATD